MRPISLLSIMALCLATGSASFLTSEQRPILKEAPARTATSWEYVDCGPYGSPIEITSIRVKPDPPIPGQNLTVIVDGILTETLEEGAYADVTVKLGLVKLLHKTYDICNEARNAHTSVQCPVEPGSYSVAHTVLLPQEIPRAKFNIAIRGYTVEDEDLICLDLKVDFMRWLWLW